MTLEVRSYRKRPLPVEAIQLTFANAPEVARWCEGDLECYYQTAGVARVIIHTPEGAIRVQAWRENPSTGPWVMKTDDGRFGVCACATFDRAYEEAPKALPAKASPAKASA